MKLGIVLPAWVAVAIAALLVALVHWFLSELGRDRPLSPSTILGVAFFCGTLFLLVAGVIGNG